MVEKGKYNFDGQTFQLPINWAEDGHAIHGLLADQKFEINSQVVDKSKASVELLHEYNGNVSGYPFPFLIQIYFTLDILKGFVSKTIITNNGKTNMPLSDGWHPYFNLKSPINELYIKVPSEIIIEINDQFIPTGKEIITKEYLQFSQISQRHFDTCFQLDEEKKLAITHLLNKKFNLDISVWQETGPGKYNYVLLYTHPNRKSIAIEPMTAPANTFNNEKGLIILKPTEKFEADFGIYLS